jgi:hypothetical protein
MSFLPYSIEIQEIVLASIKNQPEKDYFHKIISRFNEKGLTKKAKYMFPKKPSAYYRIFCFIKKSNATVVIDAKKDCDLIIYVRIENQKIFDKLSGFTDNVRNQILNAKNCSTPDSQGCKGKMYIFTFNNREYIKCCSISCNLRFTNIDKNDFVNIMDIINEEIVFSEGKK